CLDGHTLLSRFLQAKDANGRAVVNLHVMNYRDTTSGPYRELVISTLLSASPAAPPLASDPLPLLASTVIREDLKWCLWRLWLNQQPPIDYGMEQGTEREGSKKEERQCLHPTDCRLRSRH